MSDSNSDSKTVSILKKIRKIEIKTQRIVNTIFSGEYHSSYKGRGMEFDEVRSYTYGDDVRNIDWNVTARANEPFVKLFREERELISIILFDASGSNEFGSADAAKGEVAAEISSLLAFSAVQNNDKVGLIIFTDEIEKYIPPSKGRKHVLKIIREILFFETKNKGTSIQNTFEFLNKVIKKKSVVFLISDLIDEGYESILKVTAKKHDITAIKITDRREMEFPPVGLVQLEDAETGETLLLDTSFKKWIKEFKEVEKKRIEKIKNNLSKIKVKFVNVFTDENYFDKLVIYFKKLSHKKI